MTALGTTLAHANPTAERAAEAVRAAAADGDDERLRALADQDDPDPWLVADALLALGEAQISLRFARAASRPDVARLPAYLEARGSGPKDEAIRRQAVNAALVHLTHGRAEDAVRKLAGVDEAGDVSGVRALQTRAKALQALRRYEESAAAFSSARKAAESLGWLACAAASAEQAARSCFRRADLEGSHAAATRWLALEEHLESERGAGRARGMLALVESRRGAYEQAVELARAALHAAEATHDAELACVALTTLGYVRYARGDEKGARAHYEDGLKRLEHVSDDVPAARFRPDEDLLAKQAISLRINVAGLALRAGDAEHALSLLAAATRTAETEGFFVLVGQARLLGGYVHHAAGRLTEAATEYEKAAFAYRDAKERASEAATLRRLAEVSAALGDHPRACDALEEVLAVQLALDDRQEAVKTRLALAASRDALGEVAEADRMLAEASREAERVDTPLLKGAARMARAQLALRTGRYAAARTLLEQNLETQEAAGNAMGRAAALRALAGLLRAVGDGDGALDRLEEARDLLGKDGPLQARAEVRLALGTSHLGLGEADEAARLYAEARDLYAAARLSAGEASALGTLAAAERARGHFEASLEAAENALVLLQKLGATGEAALARLNVALAKVALGRGDEAVADLEAALTAAEDAASVDAIVQCRWSLASVHLRRGNHAAAVEAARQAIDSLSAIGRFLAEGEGARSRALYAPVFEIGALASLGARDVASLHDFLERGRAGTLLAALGGRDALRQIVVPEAMREREAKARAAEAVALAGFREARATGRLRTAQQRRRELVKATDNLRREIEAIQREMRTRAGLVYPVASSLADVRAALDPEDVYVAYAMLDEQTVAVVLTPTGGRVVSLGSTSEIEAAARAVLLEEPPYVAEEGVAAARARLLEPLGVPADTKRLLLAPDGLLGYLPWGLLVENRDVACLPSGSVHVWLSGEKTLRGEKVLALGDPDYGTHRRPRPGGERAGSRGDTLARLPATRDEALAVGDVVLLDAEATETRLAAVLATVPRWRAVHFACHGLIDVEQPVLSSLALTADDKNDGFLTALDVFGMEIPADLVVLSGCETGRGRTVSGEGIIGLTRAFMFAGSPRVLCSLWKVDDAATRALMETFYALWNPKDGSRGLAVTEALRQAQAHVRKQPEWKHPRYWAAWVLWGLPH